MKRWANNPKGPTDRQLQVLIFMHLSIALTGQATIRGLMADIGINSTNAMKEHLTYLRKKGLITMAPKKSATMRLTPKGLEHVRKALTFKVADEKTVRALGAMVRSR